MMMENWMRNCPYCFLRWTKSKEDIIEPDTRGDPGSPLRWTCKSVCNITIPHFEWIVLPLPSRRAKIIESKWMRGPRSGRNRLCLGSIDKEQNINIPRESFTTREGQPSESLNFLSTKWTKMGLAALFHFMKQVSPSIVRS